MQLKPSFHNPTVLDIIINKLASPLYKLNDQTEKEITVLNTFDNFSRPITSSLGPYGKLSIIKLKDQLAFPTKDGATIAFSSVSSNPQIQALYEVFRQASIGADIDGGDGTTSATTIAREFIYSAKDKNVDKIKRAIVVIKGMMKGELAVAIDDKEREDILRHLAMTASNGDKEITDMVIKAFDAVGADGNVMFRSDSRKDLSLVVNYGFQANVTPSSMSFIRHDKEIVSDPIFVVSEKPIFRVEEIMNVLSFAVNEKRPLIIVASGFDGSAVSIPLKNHLESNGQLVCFEFATVDKTLLRHIATTTGAFLIPNETANIASLFKSEDDIIKVVGGSSSCQISSDGLIIVEGLGLSSVEKEIEFMKSNALGLSAKEIEDRTRALRGKSATILVGGRSNAERKESYDRVEDTVNSYRHGLVGGVTTGAGLTLMKLLFKNIDMLEKESTSVKEIVIGACLAVFRVIKINKDSKPFSEKEITNIKKSMMENSYVSPLSATKSCNSLIEFGVVDAVPVLISSVENAISIAELILNSKHIIVDDRQ